MNEDNDWIPASEKLPECPRGVSFMCSMSEPVLVRGNGKDSYPWVAHLHMDEKVLRPTYVWGVDKDEARYTWLSPHRDIEDNQRVTHWRAISAQPKPAPVLLTDEEIEQSRREAGLAFLKRPLPAADLMDDEDPEYWVCRAIEAAVLKKNGLA